MEAVLGDPRSSVDLASAAPLAKSFNCLEKNIKKMEGSWGWHGLVAMLLVATSVTSLSFLGHRHCDVTRDNDRL